MVAVADPEPVGSVVRGGSVVRVGAGECVAGALVDADGLAWAFVELLGVGVGLDRLGFGVGLVLELELGLGLGDGVDSCRGWHCCTA